MLMIISNNKKELDLLAAASPTHIYQTNRDNRNPDRGSCMAHSDIHSTSPCRYFLEQVYSEITITVTGNLEQLQC